MSSTTSAAVISSSSSTIQGCHIGNTENVAQVQVACDACGASLVADAAYCERCGARTRRARRMVRLAIRVEAVFFLAVIAMVGAFIWAYSSK